MSKKKTVATVKISITDLDIFHDLLNVLCFAYNKLSPEDKQIIDEQIKEIMERGGFIIEQWKEKNK